MRPKKPRKFTALMSSKEREISDESFFKVKPLPWRSEEFNCLLEDIDFKYFKLQTVLKDK
jgi:hypothetical protein